MGEMRDWIGHMKRTVVGRPRWSPEKEFKYYAAGPAVVLQHRAAQARLEREIFAPGLRLVRALGILDAELLAGARVLDIGAGECWLAEAIAFLGKASEVWAADAVPKQIWAAAERHGNHPHLRFLIADACDLPFASDQFDVVVGNLVLHHIQPLEDVLAEAFRGLAPGGRLAVFEPNPILGAIAHGRTSENEAPVGPCAVVRAAVRVGFINARYQYWWSRFETSHFGLLSPGYRVHAYKPGAAAPERPSVRLRRDLWPMGLPGLRIDSECKFQALANAQAREILRMAAPELLSRTTSSDGRPAPLAP